MRALTKALAIVAFAALAAGAQAAPVAVGDPAADFGGKWLNHTSTTLAELKGRVVLIVFWRTW